jgi:P-type Cu+ transporter
MSTTAPILEKDPVCGMTVEPARAAGHVNHAGKTYYFCSKSCVARFTSDPEKYLKGGPVAMQAPALVQLGAPAKSPVTSAIWTCPMHPEVRQNKPGACPICGMALEPETFSADVPEDDSELRSMSRRFWVSLVLSVPLLVASMLEMVLPSAEHFFAGTWFVWAQLALATPVVLWGGAPFFERGWNSLRTMQLNMFTLIGLGTAAAYLYSLIAVLAPGMFPPNARMHNGYPGL